MGLPATQLNAALDALAVREPAIAAALARVSYPAPRIRPRGYETLLRTIIGQQVSVASATAIWNRLAAIAGPGCPPEAVLALDAAQLRSEAGLSRQKASYAHSLAEEVVSGRIDFRALPADDEEAVAALTRIKGIGRWSAEIYLLFAEGRPDIWPAGDLAVQIEVGYMLGLEERPSERDVRVIAEAWRPHRGAAAIFAWHHYGERLRAGKLPV
jgi:DNA-3-methyladenine glycosylase II